METPPPNDAMATLSLFNNSPPSPYIGNISLLNSQLNSQRGASSNIPPQNPQRRARIDRQTGFVRISPADLARMDPFSRDPPPVGERGAPIDRRIAFQGGTLPAQLALASGPPHRASYATGPGHHAPYATGPAHHAPYATGPGQHASYATGAAHHASYATGPGQNASYATGPSTDLLIRNPAIIPSLIRMNVDSSYEAMTAILNVIMNTETPGYEYKRASYLRIFQAYVYLRHIYIDAIYIPYHRERQGNRYLAWRAFYWTLGSGAHFRNFTYLGFFDMGCILEYTVAAIQFLFDEGRVLLTTMSAWDEMELLDAMKVELVEDFCRMFLSAHDDSMWYHYY